MKDFFKRKAPFLIFLPVFLLELAVFSRTARNYFLQKPIISQSPDSQIALEIETNRILGASQNTQLASIIDKTLIGLIIFSAIFLGLLWFKTGSEEFEK